MNKYICIAVGLLLLSGSAFAIGKKEVREIIAEAYPGATITEIEKETYQGKKIYEVDFKHDSQKLEAIISLEGQILKVQSDD